MPDDRPNDYRKSTRARKNMELYKKDQAYCRDLFVKSGALSEEDLAKYIISIKPERCNDPDWDFDEDGGSATFDNQIAFIFRDRTTKALYKLIYDVRFTASANGWSSPGSYWEPPDGEEWHRYDISFPTALERFGNADAWCTGQVCDGTRRLVEQQCIEVGVSTYIL